MAMQLIEAEDKFSGNQLPGRALWSAASLDHTMITCGFSSLRAVPDVGAVSIQTNHIVIFKVSAGETRTSLYAPRVQQVTLNKREHEHTYT